MVILLSLDAPVTTVVLPPCDWLRWWKCNNTVPPCKVHTLSSGSRLIPTTEIQGLSMDLLRVGPARSAFVVSGFSRFAAENSLTNGSWIQQRKTGPAFLIFVREKGKEKHSHVPSLRRFPSNPYHFQTMVPLESVIPPFLTINTQDNHFRSSLMRRLLLYFYCIHPSPTLTLEFL